MEQPTRPAPAQAKKTGASTKAASPTDPVILTAPEVLTHTEMLREIPKIGDVYKRRLANGTVQCAQVLCVEEYGSNLWRALTLTTTGTANIVPAPKRGRVEVRSWAPVSWVEHENHWVPPSE